MLAKAAVSKPESNNRSIYVGAIIGGVCAVSIFILLN